MTTEIFSQQRNGEAQELANLIATLGVGRQVNWNPDHLALSAWLTHVPFGYWVVNALRPRSIVELGTDRGVSYASFCQAVERLDLETRCYAVDTWKGDRHAGENGDEVFASVSRVNEARWARFSSLLRMTFADARKFFDANSVDLLHIDGFHTYEAVSEDFQTWRDTLTNRGIVLFHDTNERSRDFGVWRFWQEQTKQYPHFEFLHGHGLGVLGVGSDLPEALTNLFECSNDIKKAAMVRNLFSVRGEAVQDRYVVRDAQDRLQAAWPLSVGPSVDRLKVLEAEHFRLSANEAELLRLRGLEPELQRLRALDAEWRQARRQMRQQSHDLELKLEQLHHVEWDLKQARAQADRLADDQTRMLASASWRITRPLRNVVGFVRGDPAYRPGKGSVFGCDDEAAAEPGQATGPSASNGDAPTQMPWPVESAEDVTPGELFTRVWPDLTPLATFPDTMSPRRLSLLADSISSSDVFGSVGIAVVLAVLIARRHGLSLRVVTRDVPPEPAIVGTILATHGIECAANIEFEYSSAATDVRGLALGDGDFMLTTCWRTTSAALRSMDPNRIFYLLQDDERLHYPVGDQQLRCREILSDTRLRFIVSTASLFDAMVADGVQGVATNGAMFEPAFPTGCYFRESRQADSKRRFVFYARPHHPGDLFLRGLDVLSRAIESEVLNTAQWDVSLLGKDIPPIVLPHGVRPQVIEHSSSADCAAVYRDADIVLSLTSTPHPGYSVLEPAASGAVVVTNSYGLKRTLDGYTDNILCAEPSVTGLTAALKQAIDLVDDESRRAANFDGARIGRDWDAAVAPVLDWLAMD